MEFGGGLDIPITKNIQIRPVEVDYLGTHFGANHVVGYSAWQANFKYVAGFTSPSAASKPRLNRPLYLLASS
jgi:hypothetical protein